MEITFGWGLDGARWSRDAAVGRIRVGPAGLADVLATRLGRGIPPAHPATRVAAYRTAIAEADPPWCRRSFAVDAWSTARRMLAWRDELVRSGWDGRPVGGEGGRLAALSAIEARFAEPGDADVLRAVAAELRHLAAAGGAPDLGIDRITVLDDPAALPAPWPGVLADLAALGVAVARGGSAGLPGRLRIILAEGEADAAEAAARVLATAPGTGLLATADTALLDHEAARRGQARTGRLDPSDQRATAQVAPMFLDAITAPLDVHAVAALLDLAIATVAPGTGEVRAFGVFPSRVRSALLDALTREPGIGGPAWRRAIADLIDDPGCPEGPESTEADTRRVLVRDLDAMLADPVPFAPDGADAAALRRRLGWLRDRLRRLGGGAPELLGAAEQVSVAIDVLGEFGRISAAELQRVIGDCCVEQPSPLAGAEAATRPRFTHPAQIDGGPVLWWTAVDDGRTRRRTWTDAELAALAGRGAHPPAAADLAELDADAALAGLGRAAELIAVLPRRLLDAPVTAEPLLLFLADRLAGGDPGERPDTGEAILAPFTVDAADLVDGGRWRFGGAELAAPSPEPWAPDAAEVAARAVDRELAAGPHLLPDRLSFSQIEKLLAHRLEWLLGYQLGVGPGWVTEIPSGNRMIGTFLHGIVETLVADAPADRPARPTAAEVSGLFDELLPRYASELSLPGRARLREQVRQEAMASIPGLFRALADAGLHPVAAEADFSFPLRLTLRDPGGDATLDHEVQIRGFRDLDAEDAAGGPAVVDLKYTGNGRRYRDRIGAAQDLQLVVYARSLSAGAGGDAPALPLAAITTAYFGLKDAVLATGDAGLGGADAVAAPEAPLPADHDALWAQAVASIEAALSEIAFGPSVHDEGNALILAAREDGKEHRLRGRAEERATAAALAGRHLPTGPVAYPDYPIITGIEADLS
ncbi:PD-(D/E)XK nuclease family protein [Corynebacterium sphenisci]|uniref:PD-(D/E)XK nuclease family protein n=1 Tax=Corynebacterium sphenisci TaxID=191493 RepID=UPI0026E0051D|nr:PD-(D/E)XK nuclease family protein [Corynebacterium sphenisci]MDO5730367.1 PD-(D/E)XK nuclease family protein [Corynebacterium sphenisci]